jgi:hypothetical protein
LLAKVRAFSLKANILGEIFFRRIKKERILGDLALRGGAGL